MKDFEELDEYELSDYRRHFNEVMNYFYSHKDYAFEESPNTITLRTIRMGVLLTLYIYKPSKTKRHFIRMIGQDYHVIDSSKYTPDVNMIEFSRKAIYKAFNIILNNWDFNKKQ